ncbi:MerR family transcriptional regulator [Mycoplasmatota bacterium]|nr:MerR family transcriptional regulator [Mycoplasmatota bacterium]
MLINCISKRCGVSIDTLRYYDKIGLLSPSRRNKIRDYSEEDVEILDTIIAMKNMLFSLEEIKNILDLDYQIDQQMKNQQIDYKVCKVLLTELNNKYEAMIKKESDIKKIKGQLKHLISKINDLITREVNEDGQ